MGTGEASGESRANDAAEAAISNPLLEDVSMTGAKGVLINIIGGSDLTLYEVDEAANRVRAEVDPDANIIVGSTFDPNLEGKMRVSVVATGVRNDKAQRAPALEIVEKAEPEIALAAVTLEQPALPSLEVAALAAAPEAEAVTSSAAADTPAPEKLVEPIMYIDDLLEEENRKPLSMGASDPVDPLGKSLVDKAFISPRPVQPQAKAPIVASRDALAPKRPEAAARQAPSLLVRMGLFGRKAAERTEPVIGRGVNPAQGLYPKANPKDKAALRSEPADKANAATGKTSELDIPAFLRRTAN
jgi:cell division protein FtsZ